MNRLTGEGSFPAIILLQSARQDLINFFLAMLLAEAFVLADSTRG
jgi:hypothetical protein